MGILLATVQVASAQHITGDAYTLVVIADHLQVPTYLTHADDERLFVIENRGRIRIIDPEAGLLETPFLDISNRVATDDLEQGLISLAFDPDYADNDFFYIYYIGTAGQAILERYRVSDDPNVARPNSGRIMLTIPQPTVMHKGGQLHFGADGLLYLSVGDGGANVRQEIAQDRLSLLGKMLRLDVHSQFPYAIPDDNPFVDLTHPAVRRRELGEIWALGFRNPWRFSFDRATGDLYIADVGPAGGEEVNIIAAGSNGGLNFGWPYYKADAPLRSTIPDDVAFTFPAFSYNPRETEHGMLCAIIGGYVYRGAALPELDGQYLYGDFCSGTVFTLQHDDDGAWTSNALLDTDLLITSFGEGADGELYLLTLEGTVWRIVKSSDA